jgi:hypothetical protein
VSMAWVQMPIACSILNGYDLSRIQWGWSLVPLKGAPGGPWSSISPIAQADIRKEAPMTTDATVAHTITSLFVFIDDKPLTSSLTISTTFPQVSWQVQRRETLKRKNERLLLCTENDRCWCGDPYSLINRATES